MTTKDGGFVVTGTAILTNGDGTTTVSEFGSGDQSHPERDDKVLELFMAVLAFHTWLLH